MGSLEVWQACLWGMLGAGLVEASEMWRLHRHMQRFPWTANGKAQVKPYMVAVGLRFFMAGGISAGYAAAGQVAGSMAALTLGITAPMIIQQIADTPPRRPAADDVPLPAEPLEVPLQGTPTAAEQTGGEEQRRSAAEERPAADRGSADGR